MTDRAERRAWRGATRPTAGRMRVGLVSAMVARSARAMSGLRPNVRYPQVKARMSFQYPSSSKAPMSSSTAWRSSADPNRDSQLPKISSMSATPSPPAVMRTSLRQPAWSPADSSNELDGERFVNTLVDEAGTTRASGTAHSSALARPVRLADDLALKLADRAAREGLGPEHDLPRLLVGAELVTAGLDDFLGRDGGPGLRDDLGHRGLAPALVRHAEHHYLTDAGQRADDPLEFGRPDVEAAGNDHVVLAVDHVQVAVVV